METLLLDIPHQKVAFTILRMLRVFFKYKRQLLGSLCQAAVQALIQYYLAATGTELVPAVVALIQTLGTKINLLPHFHFLVTEGGEDSEGRFHHLPSFQDNLLSKFFSPEDSLFR